MEDRFTLVKCFGGLKQGQSTEYSSSDEEEADTSILLNANGQLSRRSKKHVSKLVYSYYMLCDLMEDFLQQAKNISTMQNIAVPVPEETYIR